VSSWAPWADPALALANPDRIAAVATGRVTDPAVTDALDRLARAVAQVFNAPVALVSLVGPDHAYFAGATGLPEPVATTRAVPLSHSFCQYVVAGGAPLVVRDTRAYPTLRANGATRDHGLVAYLGVPLRAPDGSVLGSVCALDRVPRAWTNADVALLADLAATAEVALRFGAEVGRHARTTDALQAHAAQHAALLDALPLIVYQAAPEPPYAPVYVSRHIEALGYTRDEWMTTPDLWIRLLHPDDRDRVLRDAERALATGDTVTYDYRMVARDGTVRWMHDRSDFVRDAHGRPTVWQGILLDRTAERAAEEALREREALLSLIYHHTSNLLFLVAVAANAHDALDATAFRCASVNRPYLEMTGLSEDAVVGRLVADLLPAESVPFVLDRYRAAVTGGVPLEYEETHDLPRGRLVFETTLVPIHDAVGRCTHLVGVASDVTGRREAAAALWRQAHHDALTGLANRTLFRERLTRALARTAGDATARVAVLFLDLDDFKDVNDSLGHAVGDELLVAAAARLLNATRGCDTVARLGGDEFAVLIEHVTHERDVLTVADRVTAAFRTPFPVGARGPGDDGPSRSDVQCGASVGIACAHVGDDPDAVLRNADLAMYHAKASGKGRHAEFAPAMHATAADRLALAADLRHAVTRHELRVEFQPIVDLATAHVVGAEALLRWAHPARGLVSPAEFIPLAETTGSIVGLGRWVLRTACREAAAWAAVAGDAAPGVPPYVSVNLSGRQLDDPGLVDDVVAALAASGLAPRALLLELTETALMRDAERALTSLHRLKTLGVRLAIDDFGTGYSSLAYLQRFPVDVLKLDRAFVSGIARSASDAALARAVVALGASLQLETVAEGIETPEQRDHLRALGCRLGQGFLFARPMDAAALRARLGTRGTTTSLDRSATAQPLREARSVRTRPVAPA